MILHDKIRINGRMRTNDHVTFNLSASFKTRLRLQKDYKDSSPPTHTHSKETLKIRNQYEEVKQKWMTQSIRKQKSAGHRWRKGRMNEGLNELPGKSQQ